MTPLQLAIVVGVLVAVIALALPGFFYAASVELLRMVVG